MIEEILDRFDLMLAAEMRAFWAIVGLYALCLVLHLAHILAHPFFYTKEKQARGALFYGQAAVALLFLAVILHAGLLVYRSYERGECPIQTRYEGYQLFAWMATLTYLFVRRRWEHIYMPGVIVNGIALAALLLAAGSSNLSPDPAPAGPLYRSAWYVWHLGASFIAYGIFTVSFAIEISYLGARILHGIRFFPEENRMLLEHPVFHSDAYRLALFAFPILTLAIVAGVFWTTEALGQMWCWESLRTASPLAWLLFAIYLHAMRLRGWSGVVASVFNFLGFVSVLLVFTGNRVVLTLLGFGSLHVPG